MRHSIILLVLAILLMPFTVQGDATFKVDERSPVSIPLTVNTVTTGPRDGGTRALRVSLLVSEIYYSIIVEKITYGMTEGDPDVIAASYLMDGFETAPKIGIARFTNLHFLRWIAWNEFELKEYEQRFRIRYNQDGSFFIKKATKK